MVQQGKGSHTEGFPAYAHESHGNIALELHWPPDELCPES